MAILANNDQKSDALILFFKSIYRFSGFSLTSGQTLFLTRMLNPLLFVELYLFEET